MASNPLSKERVAEIQNQLDMWNGNESVDLDIIRVSPHELRALLSAYRTREAAIAECEASNRDAFAIRETTDAEASAMKLAYSKLDCRWLYSQSQIDKHDAATDAARREEGQ